MPVPFLFASHAKVRDAVWMWLWLWAYTQPANTKWQDVSNGQELADVQIAFAMNVGTETIRRWRLRLERLGLIRTERVRPRYRRYWLGNPAAQEQSAIEAAVEGLVN